MLPDFAASLGYKEQAKACAKLAGIRLPDPLPEEAMRVLLLTESCGLIEQSQAHAAVVLNRLIPPDLPDRLDAFSAVDFEGKEFLRAGRKTVKALGRIAVATGVSDQMHAVSRVLTLCRTLDVIAQAAASGAVGHIYPSAQSAAIVERFKGKIADHIARIAGNGSLGVLLSGINSVKSLPDNPEELLPILQLLKNIPEQHTPQITNITPANALRVFSEPVVTFFPVPGTGRNNIRPDELYAGRLYCMPESEYERWKTEDADVRERKHARKQARTRAWGSGTKIAGWVIAGILLGGVGLVVFVLMLALSAL